MVVMIVVMMVMVAVTVMVVVVVVMMVKVMVAVMVMVKVMVAVAVALMRRSPFFQSVCSDTAVALKTRHQSKAAFPSWPPRRPRTSTCR